MAGATNSLGTMTFRRIARTLCGATLVLALPACKGDSSDDQQRDSSDDQHRASQLSDLCSRSSDCEAPLVCSFGRCHVACTVSRDCEGPANCVRSDQDDLRVCQFPEGVECTGDDECEGQQRCAEDSRCRDECADRDECAQEQVCVEELLVCADEREVDDVGALIIFGCDDFSDSGSANLEGTSCGSSTGGAAGAGGATTADDDKPLRDSGVVPAQEQDAGNRR